MRKHLSYVLSTLFFTLFISAQFANLASGLQCASFYDSYNNPASTSGNGGVVTGTVSYVPGVNANAVKFSSSYITYTNPLFLSENGSVSFWVRKNSNSSCWGGLFQIGSLGSANSLGMFFNNVGYCQLRYELRPSNPLNYQQVWWSSPFDNSTFNHVVATWKKKDDGNMTMKLFVNGIYAGGTTVISAYVPTSNSMQTGTTAYYGFGDVSLDELRFFTHALSDSEAYAEYVYSGLKYAKNSTWKPTSTGNVRLVNNSLVVAGNQFKVKGVGYQPVPIGSANSQSTINYIYSNPEILARDMPLLRGMYANTVRLWANLSNATLLDALYNGGDRPIYAILAFEVPIALNYSNNATIVQMENGMASYVNQFKNHPAVLAWAIGNENNLHYTGNMSDWYYLANRLAKKAYETEGAAYHPTMVVNGYMRYFADKGFGSDDNSLSYVDLWGHNTYTGYEFDCYFDYYNELTAKPLIFTEYGIDAYNHTANAEYPGVQSDWDLHIWSQIKNNSLGGAVMEYSDEWWKYTNPSSHNPGGYITDVQPDGWSDEEYYGLMSIQTNASNPPINIMTPRQAYYAFQQEFYSPYPTTTGARVAPPFPYVNDTLKGYCNGTMPNGSVMYYFRWYMNNTLNVTGSTGYFPSGFEVNVGNITPSYLAAGQVWKISCMASDGSLNSSWLNSTGVTVQQLPSPPPNITGARISPPLPTQWNTLKGYCNGTAAGNVMYYFQWYKNNTQSVSGSTGYFPSGMEINVGNITPGYLAAGHVWKISCMASDGTAFSNWLNSTPVTIVPSQAAPRLNKSID
jgi:hypothetical protein